MLFTFDPANPKPSIVDWDEVFGGPNRALSPEHKIIALTYLLRGYEVLSAFGSMQHDHDNYPHDDALQPSLLDHVRRAAFAGVDVADRTAEDEQTFQNYIDHALIGLCNSLTMILGNVRLHMWAVANGDASKLPTMVAVNDGKLMPQLIAFELEDKIAELRDSCASD